MVNCRRTHWCRWWNVLMERNLRLKWKSKLFDVCSEVAQLSRCYVTDHQCQTLKERKHTRATGAWEKRANIISLASLVLRAFKVDKQVSPLHWSTGCLKVNIIDVYRWAFHNQVLYYNDKQCSLKRKKKVKQKTDVKFNVCGRTSLRMALSAWKLVFIAWKNGLSVWCLY